MNDFYIFSGNFSSILGSYFGRVLIENNQFKNRKFGMEIIESKNDCDLNLIAILDSNFENFTENCNNIDYKALSSSNLNIVNEFNKNNFNDIFSKKQIMEDINIKPIWDGSVDIFEQSSASNIFLTKTTRYYFKDIFEEKNIKLLKIKNLNYECAQKKILGNCYNALNLSNTLITDQIEEVIENVRHKLENSDLIRTFYFTLEADSVYGDISKIVMDYLQDEVPSSRKQSIMLLSANFDSIFSDVLNFSVAKCLVDHSENSGDIWLMNMSNIKNIINKLVFESSINQYSLLAIALDQINNINNNFYNSYNTPRDAFRSCVNHPFRNIASLIYQSKIGAFTDKSITNSIELICKNYFIDFCETGFFELDSLDKHSILSFTSGIKGKLESEKLNSKIIDGLISHTDFFFEENKAHYFGKGYEISSIVHPILGF
ncbi:hypothetical protein FG386_003231 [Cryptosporidium ryanae]|uniref:uncharacterized protein n=1 Tax=Cryptosporidium ryanae TaxID=515981 RepID=UPI00351A3422|nr:hypothetical protein FG386_003231 [Cryptosporidium ryanae]